jgi:hypothetical protein
MAFKRCFGHAMLMGKERIPKKLLHTRMEEKQSRGRPNGYTKIKKYIEMRGENGEEIQENRKWEKRDGYRFLCNS